MTNYQSTSNPDLGIAEILPEKKNKLIFRLAVLSALGGFFFGYDTGAASAAVALIRREFHLEDLWHQGLIASTVAAAWMISIPGGVLADAFGRRWIILTASLSYAIGGTVSAFALNPYALLCGRVILGFGIGLASTTTTMYIAEMAPAASRGKLVCMNGLLLSFGRLIGAMVSVVFHKDERTGWRYMLGLAVVPGLLQFVGFLFLPESPRWLVSKGRLEEAKSVLQKLRSSATVEEEFQSVVKSWEEKTKVEEEVRESTIRKILKNKSARRALLIGSSLHMFQQLCGVNTLMYYSGSIIQMSGFHDPTVVAWLSVAVTSVNFLFTALSLLTVEKLGRRKLVLISLAGVALSLAFLAVSFGIVDYNSPMVTSSSGPSDRCSRASSCGECVDIIGCGFCSVGNSTFCLRANPYAPETGSRSPACSTKRENNLWSYYWCPSDYGWMTIVGLIVYLIFYSPGLGPIPWAINSEIYPTWARSTANSVATSTNWFFNLLTSVTFLTVVSLIEKEGTFGIYAFFSALGFIIFYVFLPETKGVPLEKIEDLFDPCSVPFPSTDKSRGNIDPEAIQYVKIRGIDVSGEDDD